MSKSENNSVWKKENFSIKVKHESTPNVSRLRGSNQQISGNQNNAEESQNNNRGE